MEALHYSFSSREAEALVIGKEASESLVEMQGIQGKEFNVMKSSLAPGVLRTISTGLARGRKSISLFEIRPTFTKAQKPKENSNLETGVLESQKLAIAITGFDLDEDWEGINREATFFTIKGIVESLLASLGRKGFRYMVKDLPAMFHPGQAAGLFLGNRPLGFMGRVHPRIEKAIDLSQPVYLAEFDLNALFTGLKGTDRYRPFSRFPQVDRDFSATVEESVTAEKLRSIALEAGKPLTKDLRFFDVYRGERVPKGHVSYAFRITLQAEDHTLTDAEISGTQTAIMNALTKGVAAKFAGLS
jgi:phenylalanyl-tRNA synthetase beta chain